MNETILNSSMSGLNNLSMQTSSPVMPILFVFVIGTIGILFFFVTNEKFAKWLSNIFEMWWYYGKNGAIVLTTMLIVVSIVWGFWMIFTDTKVQEEVIRPLLFMFFALLGVAAFLGILGKVLDMCGLNLAKEEKALNR